MSDPVQQFIRAARSGNVEKALEFIENGVDVNASNQNGLTALHLASKEGHLAIVRALLQRGANVDQATKKGNTALHIACLAGQFNVVQELIESHAGVNKQSQNGFTPLYMAAQENHEDVVAYLLKNGANQAIATEDGFTPLAVALQQGHDRTVALLLENDSRGRVRMPALHIAARKDDVGSITLLVNSDTQVDHQTTNGFTPLHVASHHGSENAARALIANGADVNFQAKNNITPLHVAAKLGRLNVLQILLENHAQPDAQNRDGLTPLHCAARSGHHKAVELLLSYGAKPDIKTKNGLAPIHMSAQGDYIDCSNLLIANGVDINDQTLDLLTPLHVAAHCGNVVTARYLLNNRCEIDPRAMNGFTPLHVAVKKMRIKVIELLLRYAANIHATTETGLTPLHIASFIGFKDIVLLLLAKGAKLEDTNLRCETPLHLATRNNQVDVMQALIQSGALVDAKALDNLTPLHMASRNGNVDSVQLLLSNHADPNAATKDLTTPLHLAARDGREDIIELLLQYGADPSTKTKKGFTALSLAAKNGRVNAARRLIQAAGLQSVNDASSVNGLTPLHVAVHFNHPKMVQLLLDKGADIMATTSNGYTPLHIAAKRGLLDIAELLLMHAANLQNETLVQQMVHAQAINGCTPLHLASQEGHKDICTLLLKHGAGVNEKALNGVTSLHLAAQGDQIGVGEVLLAEGAYISPQAKSGFTPLHTASHFGRPRMVQFLLSRHHPVDVQTKMGSTALHVAAQQGHLPVVKLLLDDGHADPNIRNQQNWTPAHVAFRQNQMNIYQILRSITTVVESWETEEVEIIEEIIQLEKPDNVNEGVTEASYDDQVILSPTPRRESGRSFNVSHRESNDFTLSPNQTYTASNDDIWQQMEYNPISSGMADDSFFEMQENRNGETRGPDSIVQEVVDYQMSQAQHAAVDSMKRRSKEVAPVWAYETMNVPIVRNPVGSGFLISFLVDARGGVVESKRQPNLRIIVPPNAAAGPVRLVCRMIAPHRLNNPLSLDDGSGLACRILEMGPNQVHFNSPILLEVPYYASLRGRERELIVFRSDNGETWKEHPLDANETSVQEALSGIRDSPLLNSFLTNAEMREKRILRILTADLPVYFAVVSRIRQDTSLIGKEGGSLLSSIISPVQAIFPQDALIKPIKVGIQVLPMNHELCLRVLEGLNLPNQIRFSPIVTVEPRRRKFHKPITLTIPITDSANAPGNRSSQGAAVSNLELKLLCSISGGSTPATWEDITGSTPLSRSKDSVSFTTTVSARFWLLECPKNVSTTLLEAATRIYWEINRVPYLGRLAIFGKSCPTEDEDGVIRALCLIDDDVNKTLECQQEFTLVATGPIMEVINEQIHQVELVEGLTPHLALSAKAYAPLQPAAEDSSERRAFSPLPVRVFTENRSVSIPVRGQQGKVVLWPPAVDVRNEGVSQPGNSPLVALEVILPPEKPHVPTISLPDEETLPEDSDSWRRTMSSDPCKDGENIVGDNDSIARSELDLMEVANMVGGDWIALGRQLNISEEALKAIQLNESNNCDEARALELLTLWQHEAGPRANGNELSRALHAIGREDVVKTSMHNIAYVTSDQEKNEARELLGMDGQLAPNKANILRVDTLHSVDNSMMVETGGDDEDAMRELETKSMDKVLADGLEDRASTPATYEGEEILMPIIDPRRGVITNDKSKKEVTDPEAQKSRQDAYLNLIEQMETLLPAVEIPENGNSAQGDEIEEEALVPENPTFQQQSANVAPREIPSAPADEEKSADAPSSEELVNIPVELHSEDDDEKTKESAAIPTEKAIPKDEELMDIPVELDEEENVDEDSIVASRVCNAHSAAPLGLSLEEDDHMDIRGNARDQQRVEKEEPAKE